MLALALTHHHAAGLHISAWTAFLYGMLAVALFVLYRMTKH